MWEELHIHMRSEENPHMLVLGVKAYYLASLERRGGGWGSGVREWKYVTSTGVRPGIS